MTKTWIHEQTDLSIAQFDRAMEDHYAEAGAYVSDPSEHIKRICEECNYLDAVKRIDWNRYIKPHSTVLDLGCGGGWLTAYLSRIEAVGAIYAVDSSKHYLSNIVPGVVELMDGNSGKVQLVQGLFSPLLIQGLDVVVAASAVHHAENLETVLREIRRSLKAGGLLFLLNETPTSRFQHVYLLAKSAAKILVRSTLKMYKPVSQAVSSAGFLSNPLLGDREYPLWYWNEAIRRAGFRLVEHVDTRLPTVKGGRGPSLEHFVCEAI